MNRYRLVTLGFLLLAAGAFFLFEGAGRILALVLLLLVYLAVFGLGVARIGMGFFGPAVCHGSREKSQVALTFDDGPEPDNTLAVLDVLRTFNAPAAFFLVGRRVDRHPEVVKAILEEGHAIGNHTYHHHWWSNLLRKKGLTTEIEACQEAIFHAAKVRPSFFRPPAGLTNPHLHGALKNLGMILVGWEVRPFDTRSSTEKVFKRIVTRTRPGSIILLHDQGKTPGEMATLLTALIPGLRARGFQIAGLPALVGREACL